MAKRLSDKEKKNIAKYFADGKAIDELAREFECSKPTIIRNLQKQLGQEKFKEITILNKKNKELIKDSHTQYVVKSLNGKEKEKLENPVAKNNHDILYPLSQFTEIAPLNFEIENVVQKDLSSTPISDVIFPKVVYMIVDKKIELETKYLKEYPDWQFLSEEDLDRKTIQIFFDLKIAKRFCNKEQKVIKVPNIEVFKIVAPILLKRGISRIVSDDLLIAI